MDSSAKQQSVEGKFRHKWFAYTGAFLFSIVLIVLVHEFGHFLAFRLRGYSEITIRINPFMGTTSYDGEILDIDTIWILLGGPVVDLSMAALAAYVQRFTRGTIRVILKTYAANAFLLESIVIFTGFFFERPITDFSLLEVFGWPRLGIAALAVIFALIGGYLLVDLWAFLGIQAASPRKVVFALIVPNIVYFSVGPILMQVISPIDSDFFKRFTSMNLLLQSVFLFSLAAIAPKLLSWIWSMENSGSRQISRNISIACMVLGGMAWVISFSVLN